jgi:hypothetical protein
LFSAKLHYLVGICLGWLAYRVHHACLAMNIVLGNLFDMTWVGFLVPWCVIKLWITCGGITEAAVKKATYRPDVRLAADGT